MTPARISQVLVWILAALTLALSGFFVSLLGGAISVADPPAPPGNEALASSSSEASEESPQSTATKRGLRATAIRSQIATIIVTAARGDCWISARLGAENGRVLEERLLGRGESVTLRGARVWMSIGASGNVDVTVNGEERELRSGTVAVVLGPA